MLTFLPIGTAYSERLPSKPFRVCPEIVTAKDTPCRVLGPTTAVVSRMEKPDETKIKDQRIAELEQLVKQLEEQIRELQNR